MINSQKIKLNRGLRAGLWKKPLSPVNHIPMSNFEPSMWICARTKPNREKTALLHLTNQKVRTYLPQTLEILIHKQRVRPLFPCYLFIELPESGQWRFIRSTRGISSLIMKGEEPAIMPETEIVKIREREDADGLIRLDLRPIKLQKGDKVKVTKGPFESEIGIYDGQTSQMREAILLEIMGRKTKIVLDLDHVEKVG